MPSNGPVNNARARREAYYEDDLLPTITRNPTFLANNQYGATFHMYQEDNRANFNYRMTNSDEVATFNIVGEIMKGQGTALGPTGNHRIPTQGESPEPICDGSKIKNVITLSTPIWAPQPLKRFINNQLATVDDVIVAENPDRPPDSVFYNIDARTLRIHFQRRFASPAGSYARPKTNRLQKVDIETGLAPDAASSSEEGPAQSGAAEPQDIEVNGLYDPALQSPYDKRIFKLVNDRLRQYDIRDVENNLIPVWDLEARLPPGTLVLANVTLHCFNIASRRYYQLLIQKLRVLDDAPPLSESALGQGASAGPNGCSPPAKCASSEFELFAKRKRATQRDDSSTAASSSSATDASTSAQPAQGANGKAPNKRPPGNRSSKGKDKDNDDNGKMDTA